MSRMIALLLVALCSATCVLSEEPDPRVLRAAIMETYWTDPDFMVNKNEADAAFEKWFEQTGKDMVARFLDGDRKGIDPDFLPVFKWLVMKLGKSGGQHSYAFKPEPKPDAGELEKRCYAYYYNAKVEGMEVIRKGWRGEAITEEDQERMRNYVIWCAVSGRPYKLEREIYKAHWNTAPYVYGTVFPDLQLPKLETILRRGSYRDEVELDVYSSLKPEALRYATQMLEGYEIRDGKVQAKLMQPGPGETPDDYWRLSDYRGSKALLVLNTFPTDCSGPLFGNMLEYFHQAYGEELAVVVISSHDFHYEWRKFNVFFGEEKPGRTTTHQPKTLEEAASLAKVYLMSFPSLSYPLVLDSMAHHSNSLMNTGGGEMGCMLLDKNGRLAHWDWHSYPHNYPVEVVMANKIESEIQKLAANNWMVASQERRVLSKKQHPAAQQRRHPAFKDRKWTHPWGAHKVYVHHKDGSLMSINSNWLCGKISEVDTENGLIRVKHVFDARKCRGYQLWKKHLSDNPPSAKHGPQSRVRFEQLEKWVANPPGMVYTFRLDKTVELFLNGWEVLPEELDRFKVGDKVGVRYDPKLEGQDVIKPVHFRASRLDQKSS